MTIALTLFALLPVALLVLLGSRRTPDCKPDPAFVDYDSTDGASVGPPGEVPRIIWSYWHAGERPRVVELCVRNWIALNPGYAVRVVSMETLHDFVAQADVPEAFAKTSPARQSDWLRLYLLHRHGGIWLDSSFILTRSLDWMIELQAARQVDYLGFYIERYSTRPECPVIDSWCMAAPAGSRFVKDWLGEFSGRALADPVAYVAGLGDAATRSRIVQKIASPPYHTIHVCAQSVLHKRTGYRLHLLRAEDTALFYQARSRRWKRAGLFAFLLIFRMGAQPPALIKLRGGERRKLEPYIRWGLFQRASIVGTFLHAAPERNLRK